MSILGELYSKFRKGKAEYTLARNPSQSTSMQKEIQMTSSPGLNTASLSAELLASFVKDRPSGWNIKMFFCDGKEVNIRYPASWVLVERPESYGLFPPDSKKISNDPPGGRFSPEFSLITGASDSFSGPAILEAMPGIMKD